MDELIPAPPGQKILNEAYAKGVLRKHAVQWVRDSEWHWWAPWRISQCCVECRWGAPCGPASRALAFLERNKTTLNGWR